MMNRQIPKKNKKILNRTKNKMMLKRMIKTKSKKTLHKIIQNLLDLICQPYLPLWKMEKFYNGMQKLEQKWKLVIVQLLQKPIKQLQILKHKMKDIQHRYYSKLMVIKSKLDNLWLLQYKMKKMFKNSKTSQLKIYKEKRNQVAKKVKRLKKRL